MVKKIMLLILALAVFGAGSLMVVGCASESVKDDEPLVADEKAKRDADEQARIERERLEQEQLIREQRLREDEVRKLRDSFENQKIFFMFDSAVLSEKAQTVLRDKADFLSRNLEKGVLIEGHCDERGSVEYNLALGQSRAESARKYMNLLGVASDRINTVSYGKERPVDPGHNEDAWAKNRRDEFILQ